MFEVGDRVVCTGGPTQQDYAGIKGTVIAVSSWGTTVDVDPATIQDMHVRSLWNENNRRWTFHHKGYNLELDDKASLICEDWS